MCHTHGLLGYPTIITTTLRHIVTLFWFSSALLSCTTIAEMNRELQCTPIYVLLYLIKWPNFVIVFFPKKRVAICGMLLLYGDAWFLWWERQDDEQDYDNISCTTIISKKKVCHYSKSERSVKPRLAQFSFTTEVVSFKKKLHELLSWWSWSVLEELFGKIASPIASCMAETEKKRERSVKSYFCSFTSLSISLWEHKKRASKLFWKKRCLTKKQFTITHEAVGEAVTNRPLVFHTYCIY